MVIINDDDDGDDDDVIVAVLCSNLTFHPRTIKMAMLNHNCGSEDRNVDHRLDFTGCWRVFICAATIY